MWTGSWATSTLRLTIPRNTILWGDTNRQQGNIDHAIVSACFVFYHCHRSTVRPLVKRRKYRVTTVALVSTPHYTSALTFLFVRRVFFLFSPITAKCGTTLSPRADAGRLECCGHTQRQRFVESSSMWNEVIVALDLLVPFRFCTTHVHVRLLLTP